ncbi:hypothetical protein [Mesorhizobium sp.]|uniref:hypothetical protein n=1 Tax=Mesorhizobium sp. TaxID=1871066 RepID=UPI003451EF8B
MRFCRDHGFSGFQDFKLALIVSWPETPLRRSLPVEDEPLAQRRCTGRRGDQAG